MSQSWGEIVSWCPGQDPADPCDPCPCYWKAASPHFTSGTSNGADSDMTYYYDGYNLCKSHPFVIICWGPDAPPNSGMNGAPIQHGYRGPPTLYPNTGGEPGSIITVTWSYEDTPLFVVGGSDINTESQDFHSVPYPYWGLYYGWFDHYEIETFPDGNTAPVAINYCHYERWIGLPQDPMPTDGTGNSILDWYGGGPGGTGASGYVYDGPIVDNPNHYGARVSCRIQNSYGQALPLGQLFWHTNAVQQPVYG